MLKGINPLLNADVLHVLRAMGHGDDLIIADTNFPSDSVARQTVYGRLLRIDASAANVVQAVLSVMPIDTFVDDAAARMEVVDEPKTILPVMTEVQDRVTAVDVQIQCYRLSVFLSTTGLKKLTQSFRLASVDFMAVLLFERA